MGAKVPASESSRERIGPGVKVPGNERAREQKFQGVKGPGSESSRERIGQGPIGTFAPGSELARERKGQVSSESWTSETTHLKVTCFCHMYGLSVVITHFSTLHVVRIHTVFSAIRLKVNNYERQVLYSSLCICGLCYG